MNAHVLSIWSSHDADRTYSLYASRAGAEEALGLWVGENWDSEMLDAHYDDFDTHSDAVAFFFDTLEDDYTYSIQEECIHGTYADENHPALGPALGPDEVLLGPQEVKATIHALYIANLEEMSEHIGLNAPQSAGLLVSIARKLES